MKKTLAILGTVAALATTTVAAPAQARGIGPGLAFGLAAGALAVGALAVSHPYGYYGPGYGYYGPRYYGPGYAYYGGWAAELSAHSHPPSLETRKKPRG